MARIIKTNRSQSLSLNGTLTAVEDLPSAFKRSNGRTTMLLETEDAKFAKIDFTTSGAQAVEVLNPDEEYSAGDSIRFETSPDLGRVLYHNGRECLKGGIEASKYGLVICGRVNSRKESPEQITLFVDDEVSGKKSNEITFPKLHADDETPLPEVGEKVMYTKTDNGSTELYVKGKGDWELAYFSNHASQTIKQLKDRIKNNKDGLKDKKEFLEGERKPDAALKKYYNKKQTSPSR
ncbi:MAG: hypothetical protein IJ184_04000 [Alphaproteobacteria bacterium]|nr:hypothetical protein [Alphaproteobacteria bacterium]